MRHHVLGSAGYLESWTFLGTAPSSVPGAARHIEAEDVVPEDEEIRAVGQ